MAWIDICYARLGRITNHQPYHPLKKCYWYLWAASNVTYTVTGLYQLLVGRLKEFTPFNGDLLVFIYIYGLNLIF